MRHVLDMMHHEKNVYESFLKMVFGKKDCLTIQSYMEACGIHPHLHLRQVGPSNDRLYMPDAMYVLSTNDKANVLQVLKSLKTPTNYGGSLHTKISKGKLSSFKLHDCHVLMQQILSLCFCKISKKTLAGAPICLSLEFQNVCAKTINKEEKEQLVVHCGETM